MIIVATYRIDKKKYHAPDTRHDISLTTTEYVHGNEMLVRLQIGVNAGLRLNNLLRNEFAGGPALSGEQFLFKKTYRRGNPTPITRSTFEEKLKRFDKSKTIVETEILEEYAYTGKNGCPDAVQIVIKEKGGEMTAVIDFNNSEQCENFIVPVYLEASR